MSDFRGFLDHPGLPGPFGAIMDEYARAAEDLCRVVETIGSDRFAEARESSDPDTTSIRDVCRHAVNAAYGYSNFIREARRMPREENGVIKTADLADSSQVRGHLAAALRHTEQTLDGLYDADEKTVTDLAAPVRWGPVYDPEMILEHGIVHLLRHRRQIERWDL